MPNRNGQRRMSGRRMTQNPQPGLHVLLPTFLFAAPLSGFLTLYCRWGGKFPNGSGDGDEWVELEIEHSGMCCFWLFSVF